MAVVLSKEDIAGALKITPTATDSLTQAVNVLDKINLLISNPLIQKALTGIFTKFGLQTANTPSPTSSPATANNPMGADKIYEMILQSLNAMIATVGNIPIQQVKDYMIGNKEGTIKMIENAVKS